MPIFKKSWFGLIICLWLFGGLAAIWQQNQALETKIVFCNVGQGDAILLIQGKQQVLIDGGPDAAVLSCLHRHLPFGDQVLETVVLTHPDADHLKGLTAVFGHFKVKTLLVSNVPKDSLEWREFYEAVWRQREQSGLRVVVPVRAQKWCVGQKLCCQIISESPQIQAENIWRQKIPVNKILALFTEKLLNNIDYNTGSIVLKCEVEEKNILLTGDINRDKELALIRGGLLMKVDILKIAHHGSKSSSDPIFLNFLQPEDSVIMCGQSNPYGHPHKTTLDSLESVGSRIWRTDQQGDIVFIRAPNHAWRVETQY
jgi:competence protein ComEC